MIRCGRPPAPAGRAGCRAPTRGATFFARQPQALQHTAHRGHTDPDAGRGGDTGAQLLQGRIGMVAHQALDDSLSSRVQAGLLTTRVGLWGNVASGTVLAQHFLDKRETDAEHVGNGALRAESPLAGAENLLT